MLLLVPLLIINQNADLITNSASFNYKTSIIGKKTSNNNDDNNTKDVKMLYH